jgi:hypothetical protein
MLETDEESIGGAPSPTEWEKVALAQQGSDEGAAASLDADP